MRIMTRLLILAPFLLLAACGESEPEPVDNGETGGKASGEVLGGSISDDMIPLEQLTSQSPRADPIPAESASSSDSRPSSASAPASAPEPAPPSEEAEAAPAAPAPAESSGEE